MNQSELPHAIEDTLALYGGKPAKRTPSPPMFPVRLMQSQCWAWRIKFTASSK
jgi:hypothetical protein